MKNHHPSCRESDKNLVWHCAQCGENESAESVLDERDAARAHAERLAAALRWLSSYEKLSQEGHRLVAMRLSEHEAEQNEGAR
jgi:hypothetical protein